MGDSIPSLPVMPPRFAHHAQVGPLPAAGLSASMPPGMELLRTQGHKQDKG